MIKLHIKEEDLSGGFRTPMCGHLVGVSTCVVCKNSPNRDFKCKIYGDCPKEIYQQNEGYCEFEDIDPESPNYELFCKFRKQKEENKG